MNLSIMSAPLVANQDGTKRLEELVERYKAGDATALDRLMVKLYPLVFRFIYRLTGTRTQREKQEDLVQTCLEQVCRSIDAFERRSQLTTFVFGICHRIVSNNRRAERVRMIFWRGGVNHADQSGERPDVIAESRQTLVRIQAELDRLTNDERDSFILHDLDGLPLDEVATILRCSTRTVKRRLQTARAKVLGGNR